MLVLSRKCQEKIVILTDPPVTVTLVAIEDNKVRLGFETERSVEIHRLENLDEHGQLKPRSERR